MIFLSQHVLIKSVPTTTKQILVFLFFFLLENSVDSCPATPNSKNNTLPSGCVVNGTNSSTVDVGECEPAACVKRGLDFTSSCSETPLCCGPHSYESVLIQCGAFMSFGVFRVKTCGCGNCIVKQTVIEGFAVGEDERGVKSVDVFFGGKSVGKTDSNGKFSFVVPRSTKRAIVTFKDLVNQKYEEDDRIFVLSEGQTAMYRIKLKQRPKPVTFNASEPLDLPLGGESDGDSFADLELPENALLTEDGSVFDGNAKATVSVTDPRNQSDIESAPGDFSTTSEDGEEEMLETFGMIKLNLEDDKGKPLTMAKPMKVYLDPEKFNLTSSGGNASVKLYWLDRKTGRWREAGDFFLGDGSKRRRKRSNRAVLEGTVTPFLTKHTLNADHPAPKIAVRVVAIKPGDNDKIEYLSNVLVKVICKDRKNEDKYKGYVEGTTNNGVLCINIWKDCLCYVQARKDTKYYDPVPLSGFGEIDEKSNTTKAFKFLSEPRSNQRALEPLYDVHSSEKMTQCKQSLDIKKISELPKSGQLEFNPPKAKNQASLQPYSLISIKSGEWLHKSEKCFINIKINVSDIKLLKKILFMAASYKSSDTTTSGEYGFHIREPTTATAGLGNVCLQVKCPVNPETVLVLVTPMIMSKGTTCSCQIPDGDDAYITRILKDYPACGTVVIPTAKGQEKWLCIPNHYVPETQYSNNAYCAVYKDKIHLECHCR